MDCCVTNEPKRRFLGQEFRHGLAGSSGSSLLTDYSQGVAWECSHLWAQG